MIGQELKILFKKDKAYLTPDRSITFEQLGLPEITQKGFKPLAYWSFRIKKYSAAERKMFCEILSYDIGETEFGYHQKQLSAILDTLETITFSTIDTAGLFKTLALGNPGSSYVSPSTATNRTAHHHSAELYPRPPQKQIITETFYIPLKNVLFIAGGVTFDKKIQGQHKPTAFTIFNEDIREEFDAIKNYFANVLKTKKIQVTTTVECSGYEVISKIAGSPEIAKINKALIENVKFEILRTANKKAGLNSDTNLLTMEEYLGDLTDNKLPPGTFYNDEKDFLEDLLDVAGTKHYKHLRFLSSKHVTEVMKLRFTHNPFSFFFLIQGEKNYHIVWETLNTAEATYIWTITKDPDVLTSTLRRLEDIMNIIKTRGRTAYLIMEDDSFSRIYHDYAETAEGFKKWKIEMEKVLA